MGCGEQESVDERFAVTVVQCKPGLSKRRMRRPAPRISVRGHVASERRGSWEGVLTPVIGWRDGRAAAFPSVLAQVRSGAASEYDEGLRPGFGARCAIIRSTDTAFAGKRRSDPISRISFALREKSSWRRTAARMKRRTPRSRTPRGTPGFDARDFACFDVPTSSSSADCRSSSSALVRRCARDQLPFREAREDGAGRVRKAGTRRRGDRRAIGLRVKRWPTPHPAGFAGPFPSKAGEGSRTAI